MRRDKKFSGEYLDVLLETDKRGKRRETVYLRDSVNILIRDDKENFYLLNERRWEKNGKQAIKLISGLIEKGESPVKAARRELMEETGLNLKRLIKVSTLSEKGTVNQKKHYYLGVLSEKQDAHLLLKYSKSGLQTAVLNGEFGFKTSGALIMFLNVKTVP